MRTKVELAREAYKVAINERRRAGIGPASPICIFDLVYQLGIEVRCKNISSMEGLYYNDGKPLILLSSCRPRGRMAFTCAHEYGHHVFEHGNQIDEVLDSAAKKGWDPDEFLAECFAGFILMPKLAVCKAFNDRGWKIPECTPEQAFIVSGHMGVGYNSLLTHMHRSLEIMSSHHFGQLERVPPKNLKAKFTGIDHSGEVIVMDKYWGEQPVDLCVGDIIVVPSDATLDGTCVEYLDRNSNGLVYRATAQGLDRVQGETGKWASHIRVSRALFEGLVQYRHFPEVNCE